METEGSHLSKMFSICLCIHLDIKIYCLFRHYSRMDVDRLLWLLPSTLILPPHCTVTVTHILVFPSRYDHRLCMAITLLDHTSHLLTTPPRHRNLQSLILFIPVPTLISSSSSSFSFYFPRKACTRLISREHHTISTKKKSPPPLLQSQKSLPLRQLASLLSLQNL